MKLVEARRKTSILEFERRCKFIQGRRAYNLPNTEEYMRHQQLLEEVESHRTYKRITVLGRGVYNSHHHVSEILYAKGLYDLPEANTGRVFKRDELFAFNDSGWQDYGLDLFKTLWADELVRQLNIRVLGLVGKPIYKDFWQVVIKPEKVKDLTYSLVG